MTSTVARNRQPESSRLDGIEALRAVAALMIVLYHMVLLPTPNIATPGFLSLIKERFGLGVPLFYALSGFVLAHGYFGKLTDRNSFQKFYLRRYFRIAPLFYTMMLVWLIVTKLKWGSVTASFGDIVLNLLFVFGLAPGKHESIVWAGWSIGVEMLFYLVFPLIAVMLTRLRIGVAAYLLSILVASSFYDGLLQLKAGSYAYLNVVTHLPNFLAGVMAFQIWEAVGKRPNRRIGVGLLVAAVIGAFLLVTYPGLEQLPFIPAALHLGFYLWSLVFAGLILSVCLWPNRLIVNPVSTYLGKISFSLYLWHPVIVLFLFPVFAWSAHYFANETTSFVFCVLTTVCAVVAVASLSFKFVELPGIEWGKRVTR